MFTDKDLIKNFNKVYKQKVKLDSFDHAAFYLIVSEGLKSLIKQVQGLDEGEIKLKRSNHSFNFWMPYWYFSKNILDSARARFTKMYDLDNQKDENYDEDEETIIDILDNSHKRNMASWERSAINKAFQVQNFFSYVWCGLVLIIPFNNAGMHKHKYDSFINGNLKKYEILNLVDELEIEVNKWIKIYERNPILESILNWIDLCFPEEDKNNDEINRYNDSSKDILKANITNIGVNNDTIENDSTDNEKITNIDSRNDDDDMDEDFEKKNNKTKILTINGINDDVNESKGKNENQFNIDLNFKSVKKAISDLTKSIIGQPMAIEKINEILINEMYSSGIKSNRPMGILFFVGPTGVGKTETIKELSKSLYGTDQIHRFDMSEYKSEVAIQKLIGAPNGYAGYDEGGTLTNAMQKNPNAIILFDEIEKTDKTVFDLFLQLLDEGFVTSNKGVKSYFKNTIVVFTSNIGASKIQENMVYNEIKNIITNEVEDFFNHTINRPELLGRIGKDNIVVFDLISKKEDLHKILDIQFNKFYKEYADYNFKLNFDKDKLYEEILKNIDKTKGARDIRNKFELFKKHLFGAFFKNEISKEDLKNLSISFEYKDGIVKIISKYKKKEY